MLTKYTLTIGETEHVVPDECLENWDEISFSLKRTDYSGVMRSFSTKFVFVGAIAELLWDLYLQDGVKASALVAVYTFTNRHTWHKQFEESLDFSKLEYEEGKLSINALDNTLGAIIKAKKGVKYEMPLSSFQDELLPTRVLITRLELKSYAVWYFRWENNYYAEDLGSICLTLNDDKSAVVSKACLEPFTESNGDDGNPDNSFFLKSHQYQSQFTAHIYGTVRCYLDPAQYGEARTGSAHQSQMQVVQNTEDEQGYNHRTVTMIWHDDVTKRGITNQQNNIVGGSLEVVTSDPSNLPTTGVVEGFIAIVGTVQYPTTPEFWTDNTVYEYNGSEWMSAGAPENYYVDRSIDMDVTIGPDQMYANTYIGLAVTRKMFLGEGSYMHVDWSDPLEQQRSVLSVSPIQLLTKIMSNIAPDASVTIVPDDEGLLASTALICGEELRLIPDAKFYTTFKDFCDFMECIFGYTYNISGNSIVFSPRPAVFIDEVVKVIGLYEGFSFSVSEDMIYSEVDIGFAKKEYGEIDGRYEKNFTNYYYTGFDITDKKFTMVSKYRADSYGIEFTARKSEGKSTDNKADEDIFFVHYTTTGGMKVYEPDDNDVYNPSLCLERNAAFLAAMANGKEMTFSMTSSDGDNTLEDVTVDEGDNLFTVGTIEFTTPDLEIPGNTNALVQIDHEGFRYVGFINELEARYGRENGVEYKLIVKEITAL